MIKIVAIGKIKDKALKMQIDEYTKRLSGYTKLEIVEVNDEATSDKYSLADVERVLAVEGSRVLGKIKDKEYVILLDLHGAMISSEAFAKKMDQIPTYGNSDITFVIGGSLGVSKQLITRSQYRWKISDLTFTHQMVRVIVLEQIYRAYKINKNETYHK